MEITTHSFTLEERRRSAAVPLPNLTFITQKYQLLLALNIKRRSSDVHRVQLQIQLHRSACFFTGGTHLSLKDLLYTQHWNDCEENVVLQHFSPTCAISPAAINKVAFERSFEAVSRRRGRSGGGGLMSSAREASSWQKKYIWNKKPWNGGFG